MNEQIKAQFEIIKFIEEHTDRIISSTLTFSVAAAGLLITLSTAFEVKVSINDAKDTLVPIFISFALLTIYRLSRILSNNPMFIAFIKAHGDYEVEDVKKSLDRSKVLNNLSRVLLLIPGIVLYIYGFYMFTNLIINILSK